MRTDAEIRSVLDEAAVMSAEGRTDVPSMSYEEGVEAALRWAVGDTNESPLD